jgi:hypothetical protein
VIDQAKTIADAAGTVSGGVLVFGLTIAEINAYLQAASLIVGMIGVGIASYYYLKAASRK